MMNKIDQMFEMGSKKVGLPEDQMRVLFCWNAAIFLGFINMKITSPLARTYYSLIMGQYSLIFALKSGPIQTFLSATLVYLMAIAFQKKAAWPSFIFLFGLLTACHAYRYFTDFYGWKVDGSISLMMMLCKMLYFTFYLSEGKLRKFPSPIEYYSYMFFYPTAFMGPVFDFDTYYDFLYLKKQYVQKYSTVKPALKQMFFGIVYLIGLQVCEPYFNTNIYFTDQFNSWSTFRKFLYVQVVCVVLRFRYFGGWKFAQAGVNASGISFRGVDAKGVEKHDFIQTMKDTYEIEYNPKTKTECWNTSVQLWLKNVFYDKFNKKFTPQQSLILVFIVSALWHGVHPVYYLGFAQWGFSNELAKCLYKARNQFKGIPKIIQQIILQIGGFLLMNQVGVTINLLDIFKVMELYQLFYYTPLIFPFAGVFFFKLTGFGQKNSAKTEQTKENSKSIQENTKQC